MKTTSVVVKERFGSFLISRHLPFILALLAVILTLPSLWVGLQFDDYLLEQSVIESPNAVAAINEMFIFMDGDAQQAKKYMEVGTYPWFTLPDGKNAFWRPLSALTHWLDFHYFPNQPVWMHAQNIIWFALCVYLATLLYREFLPAPVAGLAALLFAIDDAHGYAIGWISNRNALLAFAFGMLSLLLYHRFMQSTVHGKITLLIRSAVCFALSIFSAEAGLAVAGYLAAYVLVFHVDWRTLLPHLLVFGIWAYCYRLGNFGGWGTAYVDPIRELIPFLWMVIERAPVLWLGLILYPPAEIYPFVTSIWLKFLWVGAGLGSIIILGMKFQPTIKKDKKLQFLLSGAGFSLLLSCSSLPTNRLLFFAGFGVFAVLASYLLNTNERSWIKRPLWFVHLFLAAILLPVMSYSPRLYGDIEPAILSATIKPTVIIVSAPSAFHADFFTLIRARYGTDSPERVWYLGAGLSPLTVYRADVNTLVINAPDGYISGFDAVFRGMGYPLLEGEIMDLNGMQVTVEELSHDGHPVKVKFKFSEPLHSEIYHWLIWESNLFVEWKIPAVGQVVEIR